MDELLRDFLAETAESLELVDGELIRFEREPENDRILAEVFRVVHSIKGTCGFLGLDRLEALTHAAETLLAEYRDGLAVTPEGVSCLLATVDRLKAIVRDMERTGAEPAGGDNDLIDALRRLAGGLAETPGEPAISMASLPGGLDPALREELERAFRDTSGPLPFDLALASVANASAEAMVAGEGAAAAGETSDQPFADRIPASGPARAVRVNVDTLEHLLTVLGELVLTRNQLLEVAQRVGPGAFKAPLQRLASVTAELQRGAMKTRMQAIGAAWRTLPRMLRDLSNELGKDIQLKMTGGETDVDRQVLDLIKDPLIHMVRNSADHGLEDGPTRARLGKPEAGRITLSARHDGGHIVVAIADDGRGLDARAIKARAVELGLATEAETAALSDHQIHKLIFRPGFSTASQITSVSGRGVGLDVVRSNMEQIGGSVEVSSTLGKGTTFIIRIPLTLAIVPALIVDTRGQRFAVPQLAVAELVRVRPDGEHRIERIDAAPVVRLRGELMPVASLARILGLESDQACGEDSSGLLAVMRVAAQRFGILVDGACGTEEIVVKPLASILRDIGLYSGNTILGDGAVVMILDANRLAHAVLGAAGAQERAEDETSALEDAHTGRTALLLVRAWGDAPVAVPVSRISRIEEIDPGRIERLGGRDIIQYRGTVLPLLAPGRGGVAGAQEGERPVLICGEGRRRVGLLMDEIVDIVESESEIDLEETVGREGILACTVIRGRAVEVIDVDHYLGRAYETAGAQGKAA